MRIASERDLRRITEHFDDLEDRRIDRTKHHQLIDIVAITICTVLCGANNLVEIEDVGRDKSNSRVIEDSRCLQLHCHH